MFNSKIKCNSQDGGPGTRAGLILLGHGLVDDWRMHASRPNRSFLWPLHQRNIVDVVKYKNEALERGIGRRWERIRRFFLLSSTSWTGKGH